MHKILTSLIKCYQYFISPMMANHCRFTPSCSHYAIEALEQHGPFKGSFMTVGRICRCHPWHEGGYDPVPQNDSCKRDLD